MIDATTTASSPANTALAARGVVLERGGQRILDAVSFELRYGECVALLGPNGAGKSTLLRLLCGIWQASAGHIELDGKAVGSWSAYERASRLAYLPQSREVAWNLGVQDLVALGRIGRRALGRLDTADREACERALQAADVTHLRHRAAKTLSGGELARVLLARALATESRILLADEPAAGLDPRHQLDMMRTLRDRATAGTACCIVLHDLSLAAQHCDRVVLLNRGRVVGEGAANKVLTDAMLDAVYGVRVARFATAIVPVASSGGPAR